MGKTSRSVMGVTAAAPKPTREALWLALRHLGAPILGICVAFDIVVWLVAKLVWDTCIGLWCWF